MQSVSIPFRGPRTYIYGADIVDNAIAAIGSDEQHRPDIRFSAYRLLTQTTLERICSANPLASREWSSVVTVAQGGKVVHVGFRPAAKVMPSERIGCEEHLHLPAMLFEPASGMLHRPPGVHSSPVEALVIAAKATSHKIFPTTGVKWIFVKADLKSLPSDWASVHVATTAKALVDYVRWDVTIDGTTRGNIVFYRGAAS